MKKIINPTSITLIALLIILLLGVVTIVDMKKEFARINGQLAHMDEEVDEAVTGVNRLLLRKSALAIQDERKLSELPNIQFNAMEHDFGRISKKDGIVKKDFLLSNSGEGELIIGEIITSCSCTTAVIDNNAIMPNKEAVITVSFDPNFHEEPQGRFFRSIFIPTNDPNNEEIELKIFVEIKD